MAAPLILRRTALSGLLAALVLFGPGVRAQGFPNKPLRLVVPFPAGGPTDIVARPLAALLGEQLKQTVLIDNRGGAGGSVGADLVAKSPADGYTLLMATVGTHAINGSLYKKLPYDMVKDFSPIALVATAPLAVVVTAAEPSKTLADYVKVAKARPEAMSYGSAGNGTPGHLTGALFEAAAQVKLKHIPYKGSAPAVTDLIGGQIPSMFDPVQSVISHINSGRLRALAVTSKQRSPVLPNVPTVAEQGFPTFEATAWWAVFAPAGLPEPVLRQLRADVEKVVASAAFADKLVPLGVLPNSDFKDSLASFQAREIAKWAQAVRDSGASIE